MKKNNIIQLLFIVICTSTYAQQFTEHTSLQGILYGEALWLTTHQDQPSQDLIISGYDVDYNNFSRRYSYENEDFVQSAMAIEPFGYASLAKIDINHDGHQDVIVTGSNTNDESKIYVYINNGEGDFSEEILPFSGITTGKLRIGDFNNDDWDDFVITGLANNYLAKLYLNNKNGSFKEANAPFFPNTFGDITIFDANTDGNSDVLITGFNNNGDPSTKLYLNDGNANFIENVQVGIENVYFSGTDAADYDNDGDLDLIVSGYNTNFIPYTATFKNNGEGNFSEDTSNTFVQLYFGTANFVDYNNDGQKDIFLTGTDINDNVYSLLYENENGTFNEDTSASENLTGVYISSSNWSDFDNDGDLDFVITGLDNNLEAISKVYTNDLSESDIDYCDDSNMTSSYVYPIYELNIDGVQNTSDYTINESPAMEDYTNITFNIAKNVPVPFTIKAVTDGQPISCFFYIDWNHDYVFAEEESIDMGFLTDIGLIATYTVAGELTGSLTIPEEALTGEARLRIVTAYTNPESTIDDFTNKPCPTGFFLGQIEDYTINIQEEIINECTENLPGETPGDTGCVSFSYKGETVSYTSIRTADGSIWLQQNLGSNKIAESATDEAAYGDLFQWGRWDDGHQNRNSETASNLPSPNNPEGLNGGSPYFYISSPEWWKNGNITDTWEASTPAEATATNGCDPCKTLGGNWRLPTVEEWQAVINAENIEDINSAFNSNLKLTVAGARSSNGLYNEGTKGYYWSKTLSDNTDFAKYLYYSNFIVNPEAGGFREQGSSIRCIYAILNEESCTQPTALTIESSTDTQLEISWEASTNETNGYNWLLVEPGQEPTLENAIQNGTVESQITNLTITNLTPETGYAFYIQTNCSTNESEWKGPLNVTTQSIPCEAPTNLVVENTSSNSTEIAWEEPTFTENINAYIWKLVNEGNNPSDEANIIQEGTVPVGTSTLLLENLLTGNYTFYLISDCTESFEEALQTNFSIQNLSVSSLKENRLKIYPNPTKNNFYIKSNTTINKVELYDLNGRRVYSISGNSDALQLTIENLASGMYILKTQVGGNTKISRLIKE